ncbi:CopG family transcriptional regulator [Halobacteriales archaeon QS_8_69_26]|nr:MAG: CopG family transcriptional regulator [Halobacteriales archaeon QS_8_69_26]
MSKITFRADDELIEKLDTFDVSKSEVMRRALREYLESHPEVDVNTHETAVNTGETDASADGSLDDLVAERVDALIEERLGHVVPRKQPQDVNVNITLDGDSTESASVETEASKTTGGDASDTAEEGRKTCGQCGENVDDSHVYCPNCGEKVSHRVFCECGDELRSDWAFCPSCGRRTTAADVLDSP